ncbi:MAG: adenylate/guanylate cyclase domain-containing protein [Rhodobiaceae bacterium]|nr:adenylate/guanylate cyclase domain-containing protein [Rhodobiaceae bacterium]MCC0041658.1 adenylate/guanylate cyclase domain-containing protein [Rhodobiaceae bacterium]MCC0052593.1 adenylate/guanylate cyclase domain-containing protein [Rhodobiaceae bacterium]
MPETDHRALPATRASMLSNLLARQDLDRLPQRVQRAIDSHDARSEVLVRMLQLAVVAVFGALYALSPKTDAGTAFSPVPYVLAAYAVFTIAGLALAVRYKLPDFVVYAMTFVDIGLLMAMIWSFHIQYQQPPSFYLKAPTLLYVFIFIALRALRFQARFVVAAGIAAILGWATLVGYAVVIGAEHMMVTRNFVTYMTTNSILIGAEFDKIITILSVTLILALAVRRGRGLLIEAVSEQMAARELSRFFDPGVAGHIRDAESEISAGEGVTRNAAVLNIDIRGFTSLAAKMDPSHVVRVLSVYHDRIVPIVRHNGGTIDKFMGDGIMASFGTSADDTPFAANALRAIDEIVEEIARWKLESGDKGGFDPATINMAVASGEIVFGAVGSNERLEFTVIGPAVNLSAKLEKFNKELGSTALATAELLQVARRQGYSSERAIEQRDVAVPGTSGSIAIARLY